MINWILNILGILIYFAVRFDNRNNKETFDFKFWLSDNFPELIGTFLSNIAIMIIVIQPDSVIDLSALYEKFIPFGLSVPAVLATSFLTGVVFSSAFYELIKKIKKNKP
jgi:hypothetical protein